MKNKMDNLLTRYVALKIYTKRDNVQGMYRNLLKLKPMYKNKTDYYYRLAKLSYRQKKWKQALDHINTAMQLAGDHSPDGYYVYKSESLIHLGESAKAISCLNEYLSTKPKDVQAWLKLANEHKKLRQWKDAAKSFESYLKLHPADSRASYQLAECYRKLKDYQHAEEKYQQAVNNLDHKHVGQTLANSYYWLGLMQHNNNHLEQAFQSYNKAIELDQKLKGQRFGIGVFHEHYKQWEYAVEAYKTQLQQNAKDAELQFKLASLLDKRLHAPEEALEYYEKALELDKVRAEWHYSLANCYEKLKDYQNAAKYYSSAIARRQKHNAEWYRRLGFALEKSGKSSEALVAFQEADLFRRPSDINNNFYEKYINNSATRYAISYEYYQVDDKIILYESMAGSRLMCNPLALFQQLLKDKEFKNYTHVWSIKNLDDIPSEYRNFSNILFVKRDTDLYMRYSSSAKFIITNSKLPKHITRKPEQKLLDTWHGTAYKTIGGHDSASPLGFKNANKVFLTTTNILTPNPHMSNTQPDCYQFKNIYSGQMAETGYPRIDATINIDSLEKRKLADDLDVNLDKPIVLYAPTWRGTYSNNVYDVSKLQNDLMKLSKLDIQLIFRGHHLSEKHIKGKLNNIKVVPSNIDSNKLLGIVDLLITDYSSIFYDYLVTDKPVIHYLYDLEEYTKTRGLYFGVDELPGDIAYTIDEVAKLIEKDLKADYKPSKQYMVAKQQFCPHEDGHVSERVIDWFFHGKTEHVKLVNTGNKPSILVYGGDFTPGNKTDEFFKKINELDLTKYNVDVLIPTNVAGSAEKTQQFKLLPEQTMFIPYMEGMIMTLQERQAIEYYNQHDNFTSKEMEKAYNRAFTREVRRALGDSKFVKTIDFAGDSKFWASFLSHVNIEK
ncbi:CDP-glycerol glycerophosphotransferase family protein [Bacillus sp. SD088]|uniref:CDP-glycerol glycerophosphotransferase family protein n=1 Tax=Bacillus sp. SD088 TaxID=2782012 RepID=UPI001A966AD3|nr:CDP-glycerol glycerophosphotransferase family protein [Bacillus sp. SD088]MBO0991470.1 CDP-glycerol glycerophosphotransferase family protein [Bacillus sp. SD088]